MFIILYSPLNTDTANIGWGGSAHQGFQYKDITKMSTAGIQCSPDLDIK